MVELLLIVTPFQLDLDFFVRTPYPLDPPSQMYIPLFDPLHQPSPHDPHTPLNNTMLPP
ncbi:hypothetical protein SAICODRAFT_31680 [Saitoella complicata NRRL Y-17804]|uniref:uncharacterized protein n=1 Tax=Saitoella complicata (strain BCRC 22490 / CBS 7301 / JCM 7358 / NBRC 10748 / NRRL Y-17804) TaxID=698492 RepID=UPI000866FBE3|nr:uncharacterized protein SAICODRAFT_31680 [Saitoella complicata NRRL Y-17804]ODQ50932.1 hypothetical protein SAICODRAFT_31680 [Saitoella complicata NRRL Y-17804]